MTTKRQYSLMSTRQINSLFDDMQKRKAYTSNLSKRDAIAVSNEWLKRRK
jgi:hypothetical protein